MLPVIVKHILFPFDFSRRGVQAVPFVRALAERFGATVTLFGAVPPVWDATFVGAGTIPAEDVTAGRRELKTRLDQALVSELDGVKVNRVAESGDPAHTIRDFAHSNGVDLIMMPTHGVGLFRSLLLGSVTAKVLHDVSCAVWTATHGEEERSRPLPRTILCAVDGSSTSPALLQWSARFCTQLGATLKVLHVVGAVTDWPSLERESLLQDEARRGARAHLESILTAAGVDAPLRVAVGDIVPTVTEEARQEDADLVLIGRGSIAAPLGRLRTHAYGIIRRSPCPVLSV